jgi:protein-tyrosine phosphatase
MIDLHCHILHGMDDGPSTLRESVEMCRMAAADGTETVVATPHFTPGRYHWTGAAMQERILELRSVLQAENVPLTVLPGADVAVFPELPAHPGLRTFLSLNNSRYLLLEFPHAFMPPGWDSFLRSLIAAGTIPVITHPERNDWFIRHPAAMGEAVRAGALVQVTAMSLLGGFGNDARKFCVHLLKSGLVHVMASDGHAATERPPLLSEGMRAASALIGEERARELVQTVPQAIIEDRPVRAHAPRAQVEGKRGWLGYLARMFANR